MKGERSTTIASNSLGAASESRSLLSKTVFNIGDLPETLLPEILCRLPCKDAFRCKCVCKFWFTIISHPYYWRRALYLQQDNCFDVDEPILPMLVRYSYRNTKTTEELFTVNSNRSLQEFRALDISLMNKELAVVATYNDLILLRETLGFHAKYYICNPYTKEWVTIPLTCSYLNLIIGVGFICDSNYRYRIVQLLELQSESPFKLTVKIFSSETGIWIEAVVLCPQRFVRIRFEHILAPAVAYDGTLYWLGDGGFLIGLEPFNLSNNPNDNCQFISEPNADVDGHYTKCMGVYKGCVTLCRFYYSNNPVNPGCSLSLWELKEVEDGYDREVVGDGGRKMKWNFKESVVLDSIDLSSYYCWALALDSNDENILYLQRQRREESSSSGRIELVACNIRTKTLIEITPRVPPSQYWVKMKAFPIMRPCWQWPTPLSKFDHR